MTPIPPNAIATLKKYEALKLEAKVIEEQIKALQPEVIPYIPEGSEVQTDQGSFSVARKTEYVYSPELQTDEVSLKERKALEVQTGTATAKPGALYVVYRAKKITD